MGRWGAPLAAVAIIAAASVQSASAQWRDITDAESRIVVTMQELQGAPPKIVRNDQWGSTQAGGTFPNADEFYATTARYALGVNYAQGSTSRATWQMPSWEQAITYFSTFRGKNFILSDIRELKRAPVAGRDIGPTLYRRVSVPDRGRIVECVFWAHAYDHHWMRGYFCALSSPLAEEVALRAIRSVGVKHVFPIEN